MFWKWINVVILRPLFKLMNGEVFRWFLVAQPSSSQPHPSKTLQQYSSLRVGYAHVPRIHPRAHAHTMARQPFTRQPPYKTTSLQDNLLTRQPPYMDFSTACLFCFRSSNVTWVSWLFWIRDKFCSSSSVKTVMS